jgi:hypothetical protein
MTSSDILLVSGVEYRPFRLGRDETAGGVRSAGYTLRRTSNVQPEIYIRPSYLSSALSNSFRFGVSNLAISIAVDVGLDQDFPNMNVFTSMSSKGLY